MYECVICHSLNHSSRYQCQNCGTIPACYSMSGVPVKRFTSPIDRLGMPMFIPVVAANGCQRQGQHRTVRAELKTVELDYYASE